MTEAHIIFRSCNTETGPAAERDLSKKSMKIGRAFQMLRVDIHRMIAYISEDAIFEIAYWSINKEVFLKRYIKIQIC